MGVVPAVVPAVQTVMEMLAVMLTDCPGGVTCTPTAVPGRQSDGAGTDGLVVHTVVLASPPG